jgi:nucleotide-binding universal stress UspA family protein
MYSTILWASDGSESSDIALEEALRLLEPGGHLIAFHSEQRFTASRVGGLPVYPDEPDRIQHIRLQVDELRQRGIDVELTIEETHREPVPEIVHAAEAAHVEAIVCGTRGLHGLTGLVSGSMAARLVRHAPVPVIVVPMHVATHAVANAEASAV